MNSKSKKSAILLVILLFPPLLYLLLAIIKDDSYHLMIYYPEDTRTTMVDGKEKTDTVYHTIPPYKFVNQNGDTITEKIMDNKMYVADFFFTTCPTICPKMMKQMQRVDEAFKNRVDFMIISHSVNPEHDTVEVLKEYAKLMNANPETWNLVTGKRKDIYDIGIDGYKIAVNEDPRAPGGFLHSELFVLVDKQKRIRGYYDGTDSAAVDKLIKDVYVLASEYPNGSKPKIYQKHP